MKLISNWRQAWKLNSVQAATLLAFLSALQANVLPQVQGLIPADLWPYVTGAIALAIIVLRLRDQPGLREDESAGAAASNAK